MKVDIPRQGASIWQPAKATPIASCPTTHALSLRGRHVIGEFYYANEATFSVRRCGWATPCTVYLYTEMKFQTAAHSELKSSISESVDCAVHS